jgi:hypothetical protein
LCAELMSHAKAATLGGAGSGGTGSWQKVVKRASVKRNQNQDHT